MAEAVSTDAASGAAAKESKGKHKAPKIELSGAQKAAAVIVALGAEKGIPSLQVYGAGRCRTDHS